MNVLLTLLLPLNIWGHGQIESINCINKKERIELEGFSTQESNTLNFNLKKIGQTIIKNKKAQLSLSDTVNEKAIIENIKFTLGENQSGWLKVPEISSENRFGTGQLQLSKVQTVAVSCKVIY